MALTGLSAALIGGTMATGVAIFLVFMALVGWHPTDKRGAALGASCMAEYTIAGDCSRIHA